VDCEDVRPAEAPGGDQVGVEIDPGFFVVGGSLGDGLVAIIEVEVGVLG
jgi:hypothetical protein